MKTGTPPRLKASTIDFSCLQRQDSDPEPQPFSFTTKELRPERLPSYFSATSPETHRLIRENISYSPLYSGIIKGIGARYCPSLEDKVMRFGTREAHPVVLEHEGLDTEEIYAKGLGNSLPLELQQKIVNSVRGLEQAEIMRPAYAIEYDFVQPTQLKPDAGNQAYFRFISGRANQRYLRLRRSGSSGPVGGNQRRAGTPRCSTVHP